MSDQERAVIEAAKALREQIKQDGGMVENHLGREICSICKQHIHAANCQLVALVNVVDEMNTNPAFYSPASIENNTIYGIPIVYTDLGASNIPSDKKLITVGKFDDLGKGWMVNPSEESPKE